MLNQNRFYIFIKVKIFIIYINTEIIRKFKFVGKYKALTENKDLKPTMFRLCASISRRRSPYPSGTLPVSPGLLLLGQCWIIYNNIMNSGKSKLKLIVRKSNFYKDLCHTHSMKYSVLPFSAVQLHSIL